MIGSDTPDLGANRSGVFVEEGEDRSTLTLYARNRLVSWVVSVLAVFLATGALSLAANGLRASDYLTAFVMVGVALAVVWLTWYVGWRKRPFHIVFITDHLEVGGQSIAYSDIQSVGLSRDGGDAYDPQSCRSTIIFLISAIALAGFRPLGQVLVQFMIVWQR
jgi:uncharacterized membrane protein YobD (UPF0266 family)